MIRLLSVLILICIPFVVFSQDSLPTYDYCKDIKIIKDKFDKKVRKLTPDNRDIQFVKVGKETYLAITAWGETFSVNEKGITILLDNNQRIERKNQKINIDSFSAGQYSHSVFILLTEKDILKLKKYRITDYRIYVYDVELDIYEGDRYRAYINCLVPKNTSTRK